MNKEQWMNLKANDLIISRGRVIRKVLSSNTRGAIRLLKLRRSWTRGDVTVYVPTDRKLFSVYAKWMGNGILLKKYWKRSINEMV
jgi:hypothetical protein